MRKLFREEEVLLQFGFSRSAMRRAIAEGNFPRPIRLGRRAIAWVDEDLDKWVEARRDAANAVDAQKRDVAVA